MLSKIRLMLYCRKSLLLFEEFHLPQTKLRKQSFCGHKPKQLQELLNTLPSTKTKHVSIVLHKMLPEINQLKVSWQPPTRVARSTASLRPSMHWWLPHCSRVIIAKWQASTGGIINSAVLWYSKQAYSRIFLARRADGPGTEPNPISYQTPNTAPITNRLQPSATPSATMAF